MNMVDFGMDIQRAIAAPRISFAEPDYILVEQGIPDSVLDALRRMGHNIRQATGLGNAHGLMIEYDAAGKPVKFIGSADPRGKGTALGY
jgi:gamma-glutamyltranspeptidase